MSYQQKLDEARALLDQHNSQVPDEKGRINAEEFINKLKAAGGTNDAALSQCAWEDLQEFGLPRLLARQVATIFRKADKSEEKPVFKKSKVEAMSVNELVAAYDPRDKTSLVTSRLSQLLSNKRFVVFNDDGTVNVAVTTKLARECLDDFPERELYIVEGGTPSKTYRVGERPDVAFDENPLYPGRVLRPDGDCDQTNRSWAGVPLDAKQVIYLAVRQTKELHTLTINDAHNIMDLVVGKPAGDAYSNVARRFAKAAALLKELNVQGRAPTMKVFKKVEDTKPNNPFGTHRQY